MATNIYDGGAGNVTLDTRLPDKFESVPSNPDAFGAAIARGAEQLGQGAIKASQFYGQVATDDAINKYETALNKILHGDPEKMVPGPDGTMHPETGFLGMQGEDAMRAYPGTLKKMEELRNQIRGNLSTPESQLDFDRQSRRLQQLKISEVGTAYERANKQWAHSVNEVGARGQLTSISNDAYNNAAFNGYLENLKSIYQKDNFLHGLNSADGIKDANQRATQDAWRQRLETISVKDPALAARLADEHQKELGHLYQPLATQFRARAEQVVVNDKVTDYGAKFDQGVIKAPPPGSSRASQIPQQALDTIKQFEGYTANAKWDYKQYSGGYGSRAEAGELFTPEKAEARLRQDAAPVNNWITNNITVPLSPSQYSGLMSFGYNLGTGKGGLSDLKDDINAGNWQRVSERMQGYVHAGGEVNDGLVKRRAAEGNLVLNREGVPVVTSVIPSSIVSQAVPEVQPVTLTPGSQGTANQSVPQLPNAPPPPQAVELSPLTRLQEKKAAIYQAIHDDQDLTPDMKEKAYREANRLITEQQIIEQDTQKARNEANEKAWDRYATRILAGNYDAGIINEILNDHALLPHTKEHLVEQARRNSSNDVEAAKISYGPGFWDAYKGVTAAPGDPSRIADFSKLTDRAGPGGDLTLPGVQKLYQIMEASRKSVSDAAVNTTKVGLLKYAESKLTFDQEFLFPGVPPLKDQKGKQIFQGEFIPKFEAAYDQWVVKDGKDPWLFLTKKNVDELAEGMRPRAEMAMDKIAAKNAVLPVERADVAPVAPAGFSEDAWERVVAARPVLADGSLVSRAAWGEAVSLLLANPTDKTIAAFDKSAFGRSGLTAKTVLDAIKEMKEKDKDKGERWLPGWLGFPYGSEE